MSLIKKLLLFGTGVLLITAFTSCALGVLLFYRDVRTEEIYKSPGSKRDYFTIKATTLSHCGCTELYANQYVNKKRTAYLFYNGNVLRKTMYTQKDGVCDTVRLIATTSSHYSVPFDSVDNEIFKQIDAMVSKKPKGIVYPLKQRQAYTGFVKEFYWGID